MSLPAALTLVPLHGRILKINSAGTDAVPAVGTVNFRIEITLRDTTDDALLAPTMLTATLDAAGEFTISLPCTDDPDVTPQGWTYAVSITTDALHSAFRIAVPIATVGILELADLAPAAPSSALVTYVLVSTVGHPGGVASLGSDGVVPTAQLPAGSGPSPAGTVTDETTYGVAKTAGTSILYSRGDHTHGTPTAPAALSSTAATPSAVADTASAGASSTAARSDHVHGRENFGATTAQTSFGASSADGTAATVAHSDHAHGTPAAPTAASVGADPSGTASTAVTGHSAATDPHADRAYTDTQVSGKPSLSSTAATSSAPGNSAATGTGTTAARADHVHGREAFGSVTAQTAYGASAADGSASTLAHSDHVHGTPALTSSTPAASAVGDAAVVGAGAAPARSDHVHAREAFGAVTAETSYGLSSANGSAVTIAHSDHTHGSPALASAAPTTSAAGDSAAVGTGTVAARTDHVHGREAFGTPGNSAVADVAAAGSATTLAHSDHVHGREAFAAVTSSTTFGIASANGTAATLARSDHTHGTPSLSSTAALIGGTAAAGTSGNAARADHVHPRYAFEPPDHNLLGWSDPPTEVQGKVPLSASGVLNVVKVKLPIAATVTNVLVTLGTLGATLTSGQCFVGIYTTGGTLQATSADQTAVWNTGGSTGNKTIAMTSPPALAAGDYYVALVANGTTMPQFVATGGFATVNVGLSASTARFGTAATGITTALPGAMGTLASTTNAFWVGLS